MRAPRLLRRLPAYLINGIGVALGVALVQLGVGSAAGYAAAVTAAGGAIYASLADHPVALHRAWHRMLTAAIIGCLAAGVIEVLRPYPIALGLTAAVIGFVSAMTLAWGARAGPISFVAILALVFTMAAAPSAGWQAQLVRLGWAALGAAIYIVWAMALTRALQPRYRTLALASTLAAMAQQLRARAALLALDAEPDAQTLPLQASIRGEAALSASLQAARDLLFAAPDTPRARRQNALLLLLIDLRDTLFASELDHELLGSDAAGKRARRALAANLLELAGALERLQDAVRFGEPLPSDTLSTRALDTLAATPVFAAEDARAHVLASLLIRARRMAEDLAKMQRQLDRAGSPQLPLERAELQLFVSLEGWPLAALRPHLDWRSPVLRHALRLGVALGSAFFIAQALPWASHPAWLVLSVAVVLRGNLEQTLARRNSRVLGTALGCLLVLGLAQLGAPWLTTMIFLVAVGVAHAFVNVRYLVTAAAAAVMALLQAHLADPGGALAVNERLSDTVLGALLAWGFSYLLPSWERRRVAQHGGRVLRGLAGLAAHALHLPEESNAELELRLARREVYDALDAVATSAQRTRVEPAHVQVPIALFATLLMHSHALLAQLAAIKALLQRRRREFDPAETEPLLQDAVQRLQARLAAKPGATLPPPSGDEAQAAGADAYFPSGAAALPPLRRRLELAIDDAAQVAQAAEALQSGARGGLVHARSRTRH
jgi:uncharacterized membrane protein YccC